ncbi:hypothetical protein SEVIR_5G242501v4 [Setaria viridis]
MSAKPGGRRTVTCAITTHQRLGRKRRWRYTVSVSAPVGLDAKVMPSK